MYKRLIRPFLFLFDAERVHHFIFFVIKICHKNCLSTVFLRPWYKTNNPNLERELMGLKFKNPVGLAAGFDKNATLFNELSNFGFGYIEIGTLTPEPQLGNPKKRLFRLKEDQALINRMGFNNEGVAKAVIRLKRRKKNIIIGGNIGKNKKTPNEKAFDDYKICFDVLYPYVDYFVINVSSPNTPNLRALQDKAPLEELLSKLQYINKSKSQPKPILLKISPDLNESQLIDIVNIVKATDIAGVIATNTTINRENLHSVHASETGGLSGKPLKNKSTEVIRFLAKHSQKSFVIIGVGGISSPQDAVDKLQAGADLIQIYTGFIYKGPQLIKDINRRILREKL